MNMVHSELCLFTIVLVVHFKKMFDTCTVIEELHYFFRTLYHLRSQVIKQIFIHGSSILTNYNNLDAHVLIRWDDPCHIV